MSKIKIGDKVLYNHKAKIRDFEMFGNAPKNYEWLIDYRGKLTIIEIMLDDNDSKIDYAYRFKEINQWWQAIFFKMNIATQLVFDFAKEK